MRKIPVNEVTLPTKKLTDNEIKQMELFLENSISFLQEEKGLPLDEAVKNHVDCLNKLSSVYN